MLLRRLFLIFTALFLAAPAWSQDKKDDGLPDPKMPKGRVFKTGAKPTPAHKIFAAKKFAPKFAAPLQVAYVPKQMRVWGNDRYGDCVSAEEGFNQDCGNGTVLDDNTVTSWASDNGFLNGADLSEVMDAMIKTGGMKQGGKKYSIGSYAAVDFSNEDVLKAALAIGPVKVAIPASHLPSGAGQKNGWYVFGNQGRGSVDHCTSICGYGTAQFCFGALGVPVPNGVDPNKPCYLHFTWGTIGVTDHEWIMGAVVEAWLRNPDTVIDGQPQPNPGPQPTPNAYTLWEGTRQVGEPKGYGDLAQATSVGQNLANTDKVSVDVKDGSGKVVKTLTPAPGPTPGPGPTPTPGSGFTGSVTYSYVGGVLVAVGTNAGDIAADLKAAGVVGSVADDVLKLVTDLKAKAGLATVLADLAKIAEDSFLSASPEQRKSLPEAMNPTRMNRLPRRGRRVSDLAPNAF